MNVAQQEQTTHAITIPDLASYDTIIVAFSGGKDSLACMLHLLELGVPREKIELWHHDVDGREGSKLMDWPCTRDYCRAVADAFGIPIFYSWKMGGFEGEMGRDASPTAPTAFEVSGGSIMMAGGKGAPGTRLQFPQVSADLSVRWCSAYLKIDVCATAIRNQARFARRRTLVVTGERAEESAARAKYKTFEPHRSHLPADIPERVASDGRVVRAKKRKEWRIVDQWRPVHSWAEAEVWAIIERHHVNPHPAYRLGWGRVSCAACIFGSPNQWASLRAVNQPQFDAVAGKERESGKTIQRKLSIVQLADKGTPYEGMRQHDVDAALRETWDEPIMLKPGSWTLPAGAFGESCGPT